MALTNYVVSSYCFNKISGFWLIQSNNLRRAFFVFKGKARNCLSSSVSKFSLVSIKSVILRFRFEAIVTVLQENELSYRNKDTVPMHIYPVD